MKRRFFFVVLVLLGLGSFVRAAVPAAEKLLTGDTLAVFTMPDVAGSTAFLGQSAMGKFWGDPAMKPFKDKFLTKFGTDVVEPLEREFGVKFSDYTGLAQGQLTLAITRSGWEGKPDQRPGFLLLMDAGGKSEELKKQLEVLRTKWVGAGRKLRSERIRDVEFSTLIFSSKDVEQVMNKAFGIEGGEDAEDSGDPLEWIVGQSGSLLLLGDHATDIEKAMILQSGGALPSLSENPAFASNEAALFRGSRAYAWVNLQSLISIATRAFSDGGAGEGLGTFNPETYLEPLGVNGLKSVAWSVKADREGSLVEALVNVPESQRKGIFKLLSFGGLDSAPPAFVGTEAMKFSRFRLDILKTWNGVESLVDSINPQMAGLLKLLIDTAGKDKDPNFDLRKNLLGNLGDDLIVMEKEPGVLTLDAMANPPALYLVGSPQPNELAAALQSLSGVLPSTGVRPKERDFLGRKVYSIPLPATGAEGEEARSLHFAASGGYVGLSLDEAFLESYLRNSGEAGNPLRARPGLAAAAEKVGGMGTGLFGYEDQKRVMTVTLGVLKKESANLSALFGASPLTTGLGAGKETFNDWVDFSLLPEPDRVSKYFSFSVFAGQVNPAGFWFRYYTPEPIGLE